MKRRLNITKDTRDSQARAADPRHSVWVSANAGAGKTHVLAQRVVRLLLDGTDPSRLLCLTYTRAAAANMSNRVFATLAQWSMLDDADLAKAIDELDSGSARPGRLQQARRLFARALETPGGLKIQTIHAFCEAVLQQFPLEANIPAHFELLDPTMEETLFGEARREMLTGATGEAPALAEAFADVLSRGGEAGLDALMKEIVGKRDRLRLLLDHGGGASGATDALREQAGLAAGDMAESIAAAAWPLPGMDSAYFRVFVEAATAVGAGRVLEYILPHAVPAFAESDPVRRLRGVGEGFLKGKGEPYGTGWLFTKALRTRLPDIDERYLQAANHIADALDRMALLDMVEATGSALTLADWLIGRYERLKSGRGFLDFNDLISRTVALLARQDAGAWVQYKLDQGIDHILLDEAQDTSPQQWAVVRSLAEEFFAGSGARENIRRTVFAVGDEKQSIYSFQGAAPEAFDASRHDFAAKVRGADASFEDVRLNWSFRSTQDVLDAVDAVFASETVRRGVTRDKDAPSHKALRDAAPGYVEVWPTLGAEAVDEPDDWTQPVDHAKAPAVELAARIAATISGWLASGERIGDDAKPITAGDILVLVRKRGGFVNALSGALKQRGIAVAGADRLSLPNHIAVKDMVALGRAALQADDDLSLAALLRSPVFNISEEALFELAAGRDGLSLRQSLARHAAGDAACQRASVALERWAKEAAFKRPFEFYAGVLGRDGVRAAMIARLGQEAGDIIDEFLGFCLAQEKTGLPSLEAFLATLDSTAPEIKREMDQTRDEVRIMTVHAAKGLEAPVVILVDGGSDPFSHSHLPRLLPITTFGQRGTRKSFLWRAPGGEASRFQRDAERVVAEAADDEYRRLLYVAMTRAEDRLIVCGHYNSRQPKATTWHAIVGSALRGLEGTANVPHPAGDGYEPVLRFRIPRRATSALMEKPEAGSGPPAPAADFPASLRECVPPQNLPPRPLAPSGAAALLLESAPVAILGRSPVLDTEAEPGLAIQRGIAMHRLLQTLPDLALDERAAAAERYIDRAGRNWPEAERRAAVDKVLAILGAEPFAPLFAAGSRAEVAVMGHLEVRGAMRTVAGTIDRLAVTDRAVQIVDYKTNRPAPMDLSAVPPAYVAQLALYRELLRPIYPGRPVEAALLFTEAPRLMAVPAAALDAALVRLGAA